MINYQIFMQLLAKLVFFYKPLLLFSLALIIFVGSISLIKTIIRVRY